MIFNRHLSYAVIDDFRADLLDGRRRKRVAEHLRRCARCQGRLRFAARIAAEVPRMAVDAPPRSLLDGALSAREQGERHIVPMAQPTAPRRRSRPVRIAIAAAAAACIGVVAATLHGSTASAGDSDSTLSFLPAHPQPGDSVTVKYVPAIGRFHGLPILSLRARLRRDGDAMYSTHGEVRTISRLRQTSPGRYEARFRLPDSVFYAVFAVEDTAATRVDDNAGRFWELLTYAPDGRPRFEALDQRAADMMGRSWEQAYASAVALTKTYPEAFRAWTLREFFDGAMYGPAVGDSLKRTYGARIDSLIAQMKAQQHIAPADLESVVYRECGPKQSQSTAASAECRYWLDRLRAEDPRSGQLAQFMAISFTPSDWKRPGWMLDSMERAYSKLAPMDGTGGHTFLAVGYQAASQSRDDAAFERWTSRLFAAAPDSGLNVAFALARRASLRREAEHRLRALLAVDPHSFIAARRLGETRIDYDRRAGEARRAILVTLGQSLATDRETGAAIDTLRQTIDGAWDPRVYAAIADAYRNASDPADAVPMLARLAVDPRTSTDSVARLRTEALKHISPAAWDSLTTISRSEMYARTLDASLTRGLRGTPRVVDEQGKTVAVRDLLHGTPGVVVFWSKDCGFAVQALPAIIRVATRLREGNTPVVLVADGSPQTEAYLKGHGWTLPIYGDYRHETDNAFVNFGTPQYFVVDAVGRVRFDYVDQEMDLVRQVDALRGDAGASGAGKL